MYMYTWCHQVTCTIGYENECLLRICCCYIIIFFFISHQTSDLYTDDSYMHMYMYYKVHGTAGTGMSELMLAFRTFVNCYFLRMRM